MHVTLNFSLGTLFTGASSFPGLVYPSIGVSGFTGFDFLGGDGFSGSVTSRIPRLDAH